MDLKEILEDKRRRVSIGGAVLAVLLLLVLVVRSCGGGGGFEVEPFTKAIYYDVSNKKVLIVEIDEGSRQLASPREPGGDVYLASIYTCGEYRQGMLKDGMTLAELESAGMKIAWIEKLDYGPVEGEDNGLFLSRHDKVKWHAHSTEEAADIVEAPYRACDQVTWCLVK